ncbi:hypothetical protein HU200_003301 [Digitaria exilis]|uniref:Peptidase A1 domain-containing protein n=1 Tax=Digitaria exilis TaxID=1010633 RepID=A0A835FVJ5_9POAL|nr:hypothetical protein HU200_003301 [Digitaria exilis]
MPILARLNKDPTTTLYTITIKHGILPLVVDLSGPLYWSRCPPVHRTIPCHSDVCQTFNQGIPPGTCTFTEAHLKCANPNDPCPTYPENPITGECAITDATTFTLSANATDGENPLFPVTFMPLGACSIEVLFTDSLPANTWGVAGMSRLPQSLPTQVALMFKMAKQFALCLPRSGGTGAAIFGGGPFHLMASPATSIDLTEDLRQNQIPFLKYSNNGGYYLHVNGINVNGEPVPFPPGTFDLNAGTGEGGVMLSTTLTQKLRSDIYRALFNAFDAATSGIPRAPAVHPFEMCYQSSALAVTRLGYAVANIELLLDNGRTWLIPGGSSLVQVNDQTVCFAFLEMTTVSRVPGSPAVLFGGYQFEDYLLFFDLDKETFSFSGPLAGIRTSCSNFNFTM